MCKKFLQKITKTVSISFFLLCFLLNHKSSCMDWEDEIEEAKNVIYSHLQYFSVWDGKYNELIGGYPERRYQDMPGVRDLPKYKGKEHYFSDYGNSESRYSNNISLWGMLTSHNSMAQGPHCAACYAANMCIGMTRNKQLLRQQEQLEKERRYQQQQEEQQRAALAPQQQQATLALSQQQQAVPSTTSY